MIRCGRAPRHARTGRHSWSLRRRPPSPSAEAEFDGSGGLGESPPSDGDADDEADGDSLVDGDEGLEDGDSELPAPTWPPFSNRGTHHVNSAQLHYTEWPSIHRSSGRDQPSLDPIERAYTCRLLHAPALSYLEETRESSTGSSPGPDWHSIYNKRQTRNRRSTHNRADTTGQGEYEVETLLVLTDDQIRPPVGVP
ncbi:hypothetical protein SSPO_039980 [Streptomyces antimycoticus]|uniref:Uncharacterized protein n=1 Tax=Streptomyces antimycoticus TaxID=68175 RepID=A0A499ULJ4_9ACTN|nr:hypothetical protein SSPO_039980 [Streptomyces antimycoticus]